MVVSCPVDEPLPKSQAVNPYEYNDHNIQEDLYVVKSDLQLKSISCIADKQV